jgi:uncharacterized protein (TIGR02099 family)
MKRVARGIEFAAWGLFFLFAALVLALRFWLLPDIERYREDIVAGVSRAIGLPVRVGAIEAGWLGLRPQVTLSDVRILDAQGREALVLPSVENVLAWRSLLRGELRLHRVVIDRPRLAIARDSAGELYIAGIKLSVGGGGGGVGVAFLGQGEVLVRNAEIEWRDELRNAPALVLTGVELRLVGTGTAQSIGFTARPPSALGTDVEVRALLVPGELSGRVFVQLGYTDLAAWRAWIDYPVDIRQGQGALRIWARLEKGEPREGTADVALADVWAGLGDHLSPLELATVRGRVHARALADGVELSGRGLALALERGPEVPPTDFQIVWRPQAGGTLGASLVDLQVIAHLVESLPLPPQIARTVRELAPSGRLAEARLDWKGPFDAPQQLSGRTRFSDLALRARGAGPGFTGLSGSLEATHEKGRLSIASKKTQFDLPQVFAEPIALDSLAGELDWQRDAQGELTLRASSLSFANAHLSGNVFGQYGKGAVDVSGVLNRADAGAIGRYLPHGKVMGEKAREWLASAVAGGQASDVRLRLRGDLAHFPFADPARGEFQVTARIDKGVLNYAPGWPRIEDIAGEFTFDRSRIHVNGRSGALLGTRLSNVQVNVPNVLARDRHVLVSGQAEGATADFLRYIASSPLKRTTGDFLAGVKATGQGKLQLKLDLPLEQLERTKVAGDYEFAGNEVMLFEGLPPLTQAAGKLGFTDSGFTVQNVRARFLGGGFTVAGGTLPGGVVQVVARGDATVQAARELIAHPLGKQLSGGFGYTVTVRVHEGQPRITLESPLRGVESALPAPLTKTATDSLPLRVEFVPSGSGERDRIALTLGGIVRAEVARRRQGNAMQVQRTAVWLTPERDTPIRLPERAGTLVYGSLAAFDLDRWLPLLSSGESAEGPAVSVDLKLGSLLAFGRRLGNVSLRAAAESAGWSANVNADEVAGDVSYRSGELVARLARFVIPGDAPGTKPSPAGTRPGDLPAMDLVAEEFTFRGKSLGRVELIAQPAGADWRIERARMVNPDASLIASGMWRAEPSRTAVEIDLDVLDAGAFLGRVNYPKLVRGGKARLQGTLDWQGDPGSLDLASLSGALRLNAEDGQFLEVEPGLGKLISLMSLQALPRRLTLDFRDVFSKGFQFDRINSNAQVERGVLQLKEFRMRGSAAEVEMSGDTHLARETQNLRVRVVPSLSDSAAVGIGLFNPVAGIAAAIAQHILKNPLGQIFAFDYSVTGTWSDPKVAQIRAAVNEARDP